jgi:hypothetical protein
MLKQQYLLCYKGKFSQDITMSLLAMTENKLSKEGTEIAIKKKVFRIMMGCLQTICNPGENTDDRKNAVFMLGKNEKEFFVYSGNVIPRKNVADMKKKLIMINVMNATDLKSLYKTIMTSAGSDELSASELTLIDIARKSGRKLEYDIRDIDENYSFFSMRTVITQMN